MTPENRELALKRLSKEMGLGGEINESVRQRLVEEMYMISGPRLVDLFGAELEGEFEEDDA